MTFSPGNAKRGYSNLIFCDRPGIRGINYPEPDKYVRILVREPLELTRFSDGWESKITDIRLSTLSLGSSNFGRSSLRRPGHLLSRYGLVSIITSLHLRA